MFVVWGVHWLLGFAGHYGRTCMGTHARTCSRPARAAAFTSQCCHPVIWFPERLPLEALGKVLLPVLAMVLELWLAQSAGYRWVPSPAAPNPSVHLSNLYNCCCAKRHPLPCHHLSSPVITCLLQSWKLFLPPGAFYALGGAPRAGRFNGDTVNNWQAREDRGG